LQKLPAFAKAYCDNQVDATDIKLPKLYYFDVGGRGECIRMAMYKAGIRYEDIRVSGQSWTDLKNSGKCEFG